MLFSLFSSLIFFLLLLYFCCAHVGCLLLEECLFTEHSSWDNQASAEGIKRQGDWLLHITRFFDSSFSSCVNKRLFFARWVQGTELDSTTEIRSPMCSGSCCSLSCWRVKQTKPLSLVSLWKRLLSLALITYCHVGRWREKLVYLTCQTPARVQQIMLLTRKTVSGCSVLTSSPQTQTIWTQTPKLQSLTQHFKITVFKHLLLKVPCPCFLTTSNTVEQCFCMWVPVLFQLSLCNMCTSSIQTGCVNHILLLVSSYSMIENLW